MPEDGTSVFRTDNGATSSVWMTSTDNLPSHGPVDCDLSADVCVVGAGIAGLTIAYLLCQAGHNVVVIDDGPIAGGESCRTTAHLTHALDDRYFELERLHGGKAAMLAAESHTAAIDLIQKIVELEQIDCDFERVDGYLMTAPDQDPDILDREHLAARRAGLQHVEILSRASADSFDTGRVLRFPQQAQFHAIRYLRGLARCVARLGRLHDWTQAVSVEGGAPVRIVTDLGHTITASAAVIATNTPVNDRVVMHTKQASYRTYVVAGFLPKGVMPHILLWDTADPYHYVRLQSHSTDHDLLIVGGEDHKTGQVDDAVDRWERLKGWTRERFPMIAGFTHSWSGQIIEPVDGLAFIGRNPVGGDNIFIATGDSGNGMTHGTIAGMLIRDLILGTPNPWIELYDPARKTLKAAFSFVRENLNTGARYAELVTGGQVDEVTHVAPGEGVIMRRGLAKVAIYRDPDGALHAFSAICPHLGCVIHWNSGEKTWDCPCHGSRYQATGRVINGPSNSGLAAVGSAVAADDDETSQRKRGA